jgi:hypothetical protein
VVAPCFGDFVADKIPSVDVGLGTTNGQEADGRLNVMRQRVVHNGRWELLECAPAWDGNWTNDCFVSFGWQGADRERLRVVVNYAPNQSQCRLRLPFPSPGGKSWVLQDQISSDSYERDGIELESLRLFVDLRPWQASVLSLSSSTVTKP